MTTAASQSRFRQSHTGLRIKDPASQQNYLQSKLLQGLQQRMHQEEDVQLAYGRPNRPSTPIRTVVRPSSFIRRASASHVSSGQCSG